MNFVLSTSRVQQGDISRPVVFYAEYDRSISSFLALVLVLPFCVLHLASFVTFFRLQLHNTYQMG